MSSGYTQPPHCMTCNDSVLVAYCSNCKRRRCPICSDRKDVATTEYGDMCLECFTKEFDRRVREARGKDI